jgi:TonB family protein
MILFNLTLLIWGAMVYALKSNLNFKWRKVFLFGIPTAFALWCLLEPVRFSVPSAYSLELETIQFSDGEHGETSMDWTKFLPIIYVVGLGVSFVLMMIQIRNIFSLKKRARALGNGCFEIDSNDQQSAFNFFNWIFLPSNLSDDLKRTIRIHEEIHRSKGHSMEKLGMTLIQMLFWFNPGVYLLNRSLNVLQEAQADALSLKEVDKTEYVESLLSSSMGAKERLTFGLSFSQNTHLKTRIKMLYQTPKRRMAMAIMSISCICILALTACERAQAQDESTSIAQSTDQAAEYPGGQAAMMKFIMNELQYPKLEDGEELEGKVFVEFTISKSGDVENVNVVRGIHPVFDEAAKKVIASFPKWSPATKDGVPVSSKLTLPIMFKYD